MIVDTIGNAKQYQGINSGVDRILEAVTAYTPDNYPVGRIPLDGENLYMNLEMYQTHSREEGTAEAHRKYIDVMYIVEGVETIYVKSVDRLQNIRINYNAEKDLEAVLILSFPGQRTWGRPGIILLLIIWGIMEMYIMRIPLHSWIRQSHQMEINYICW